MYMHLKFQNYIYLCESIYIEVVKIYNQIYKYTVKFLKGMQQIQLKNNHTIVTKRYQF